MLTLPIKRGYCLGNTLDNIMTLCYNENQMIRKGVFSNGRK